MRLTKKNDYGYTLEIKGVDTSFGQKAIIVGDTATKLGQLEDIEEELGIDLLTLIKAFRSGIYVKIDGEIDYIQYVSIFKKRKWHLYSSSTFWGKYDICLVKDYGKTWALTKEELEK